MSLERATVIYSDRKVAMVPLLGAKVGKLFGKSLQECDWSHRNVLYLNGF